MAVPTLISVEEYLSTAYSPDCDYVDGHVQERNVGGRGHSRVQKKIVRYLGNRELEWGCEVFPEQRVQISATRFRIPDICVVLGESDGEIFRQPPYLCIEILSLEDRMSRAQERIDDFPEMGVAHVWIVDPQRRKAYQVTGQGWQEVKDGVLRTSSVIAMPLAEIFD
jgi:Uma2 family endonuclease